MERLVRGPLDLALDEPGGGLGALVAQRVLDEAPSVQRLVMPTKRPASLYPIQVPPARSSRGATYRGDPSRTAGPLVGRSSASSRLAATATGASSKTCQARMRVHTPTGTA